MRIGKYYSVTDIFGNPKFIPAMEDTGDAADITNETKGMMRSTVQSAGRGGGGDQGIADFSNPTDMDGDGQSDTGDINPDASGDGNDAGGDMGGDMGDMGGGGDDMGMGDVSGDDMGMGDMGGGEGDSDPELSGDGNGFDEEGGGGNMSPEHARMVNKLQNNCIDLYSSITAMQASLAKYDVPSSTTEIRSFMNDISFQLAQIKDLMVQTLSTQFEWRDYPFKLKRYIAIRHVYSLIIEQIELHTKALDAENNRDPEDQP